MVSVRTRYLVLTVPSPPISPLLYISLKGGCLPTQLQCKPPSNICYLWRYKSKWTSSGTSRYQCHLFLQFFIDSPSCVGFLVKCLDVLLSFRSSRFPLVSEAVLYVIRCILQDRAGSLRSDVHPHASVEYKSNPSQTFYVCLFINISVIRLF